MNWSFETKLGLIFLECFYTLVVKLNRQARTQELQEPQEVRDRGTLSGPSCTTHSLPGLRST